MNSETLTYVWTLFSTPLTNGSHAVLTKSPFKYRLERYFFKIIPEWFNYKMWTVAWMVFNRFLLIIYRSNYRFLQESETFLFSGRLHSNIKGNQTPILTPFWPMGPDILVCINYVQCSVHLQWNIFNFEQHLFITICSYVLNNMIDNKWECNNEAFFYFGQYNQHYIFH